MTINEEAISLNKASQTTAEKQNYVTTMSDCIVIVSFKFPNDYSNLPVWMRLKQKSTKITMKYIA